VRAALDAAKEPDPRHGQLAALVAACAPTAEVLEPLGRRPRPGRKRRLFGDLNVLELDWPVQPRADKDDTSNMKWTLSSSLWSPRLQEDGGYYDSDKRLNRCFNADWEVNKVNIMRIWCFRKQGANPEAAREALRPGFRALRAAFRVYSAKRTYDHAGAMGPMRLFQSGFATIWKDARVFDLATKDGAPLLSPAELDRVFVAANFNTGGVTTPYLERHEMIPACIRLAVLLYWDSEICDSVEGAVAKFLDDVVAPAFGRDGFCARVAEPDDFRRERLYNKETCACLRPHMRELKNIFKRFCFEGRYMDHDRFAQAFAHVENEGLVHAADLDLAFAVSKLTMTSELDERRLNTFQFFSFLEAVWRVSVSIDPFAPEDALKLFLDGLKATKGHRRRDQSKSPAHSESESSI